MARQKNVKIQKGDRTAKVLQSSLGAWERNGWTAVDDGSSSNEADVSTETAVESAVAEDDLQANPVDYEANADERKSW